MTDRWGVYIIKHVAPIDDTKLHTFLMDCWCVPTWDNDDDMLAVHHAADRREKYEHLRVVK